MDMECLHCNRLFPRGGSSLRSGSCGHVLCVERISAKDAARRSLSEGAAIGASCPCPVPRCQTGSFNVIAMKPLQYVDKESQVIDLTTDSPSFDVDEVKSSSLPDGAVTSSSGAVVTPVPEKVRSGMAVAGGQGGDASTGVPAPCKKKARMFVGDCVEYCPAKKDAVKSEQVKVEVVQSSLDYKYETDSEEDELQSGSNAAEDHVVKEEPTYEAIQKRQAKFSRKYGDRVLLARQSADGMMKLGGRNQGMELYPKDPDERRSRMGGRYAKAYSSKWNIGAPQYAGQLSAHVSDYPGRREDVDIDPEKTPFSVFVQRSIGSTLGWEYCGEYLLLNNLLGVTAAFSIPNTNKQSLLADMKKSLSRPGGVWHKIVERRRSDISELCENDPSPPGPTRLIRLANGEPEPNDSGKAREDRLDRESHEKATNAAKARALGLDNPRLSEIEFCERLVHYDDLYGSYAIQFQHYDEEMYDFVKEGMTTMNKQNKTRNIDEDEPCAKALDWYNHVDQKIVGM